MPAVIERLESVQYDGTNGEHIATEFLDGMSVGSDDGHLLQLVDGMNDPLVRLGDWVIRRAVPGGRHQYAAACSDADYAAMYTELPS
ncbi:hypothetical protein [Streptomyces sp. NPDC127084]|uniref:hypothetical protein n=1 Tax=Streptomyces sp. NPDC127084 TaxID=3347133 RepID=UPI00366422BC